VTAVCLVGCQFVFAYMLPVTFKQKRYFLWLFMLLSIAALFYVSVSGTASYFDARSSSLQHTSIKNSSDYTDINELIAGYKSESQHFESLAKEEDEKGNDWQASQNQKEAAKAKQKWLDALSLRMAMQPSNKTSTEALAKLHKGDENHFWYMLAVLIDFCPLLCFAALGGGRIKIVANEKPDGAEPKDKFSVSKNNSKAIEYDARPQQSNDTDPLYSIIVHEIKQGKYGDKPVQRAVQENHGFNNPRRAKRLFDQLEIDGLVIRPEGSKMYTRTKKGGANVESAHV
jgi:hypothetical protein